MIGNYSTVLFLPFFIMVMLTLFAACSHEIDESADDDSSPPCEPTCWQYSPEQVTGSLDQIEEWVDECKNADSGCEGRYCVATRMEFQNAPDDLKYSVQCESGVLSKESNTRYCLHYEDEQGGASVDYLWLGPDYGFLSSKKNWYSCNPNPDDAWVITGWAHQISGNSTAHWTAETVQDALVHEITDTPCEEITDLRTCLRSFIPPDIHCTPKFDQLTDMTFIACESMQEPFDRPLGWREIYQE